VGEGRSALGLSYGISGELGSILWEAKKIPGWLKSLRTGRVNVWSSSGQNDLARSRLREILRERETSQRFKGKE